MPDQIIRAVIFDLDGTLFNTLADIAYSINSVLEKHELPTHDPDDYRQMVGSGIRVAVERAIAPQKVDDVLLEEIIADVSATYASDPAGRTSFYEGIEDLLDELSARKVPMSVLSNKPDPLVQSICDKLLGRWEFMSIAGQSDGSPRKPDPAVALEMAKKMQVAASQVMFLGDSDIDMVTAQNGGMLAAGAGWGFRGVEELRRAGARVVFDRPGEIVSYLN